MKETGVNFIDSLIAGKSSSEGFFVRDYTIDRQIYFDSNSKYRSVMEILSRIQNACDKVEKNKTQDVIICPDGITDFKINQLITNVNNHIRALNNPYGSGKLPSQTIKEIYNACMAEKEKLFESKGIKSIKLQLEENNHWLFVRVPIYKCQLYPGGGVCDKNGIRQWFGLKSSNIDYTDSLYLDPDNSIHNKKGIYFKSYSRYHNCVGYVRYLLEGSGINVFKDSSSLERFGVTDPDKLDGYLKQVNDRLDVLNLKANNILSGLFKNQIEESQIKHSQVINELRSLKLDSYIGECNKSGNNLDSKIKALITLIEKIDCKKNNLSNDLKLFIAQKIVETYQ
ncbi:MULTISPECIES: hypothetical protein [unclassified Francisella]|uniref:hypothetical protein n=1 Tax=unclassified Francisella TaxID=2610885 RepID=UPI002E354861|nr:MULTISPECIES: hypothetical protein [unclassified Francisella]MED7820256.1 hypothetical protein [Francisella sp. 19S2-4]MED7831091.1 hypothetical protein [Francisella sp. 19S2-10]